VRRRGEGRLVPWSLRDTHPPHITRTSPSLPFPPIPSHPIPRRIASCSADQTLKIISLTQPDLVQSVHANEPFTSFAFQGPASDPSQMKLVASLQYMLKVYKLRTLSVVKTIPLPELKSA
jgi:hypothetical protein